jgi:hypothetical protein
MELVKTITKNGTEFEIYVMDPELFYSIYITCNDPDIELRQHYFNTIEEAVSFIENVKKPVVVDSYVDEWYGFEWYAADPMDKFFGI